MDLSVSIIIPTYNRKQEILDCLMSINKLNYDVFEVIVIDNGSTDNTVEAIEKLYTTIKVIELKENLGAVGGRNLGIEKAKGNYLFFVDSDNILHTDCLKELVHLAETDKNIGFVGPKMYYYSDPNRIWYAGAKINLLTSKTTYIGINEIDHGQYDQIKEVEHIPNVWLVKREVIDRIGGLDPVFVMTYGEADWPMRAIKAGFKVVFCPSAKVWHNIPVPKDRNGLRGTIGFDKPYRVYYAARNRTIFMKKFAPKLNFIIYITFFIYIFNIYYIYILIKFMRFDLINPLLQGSIDGIKYSLGRDL